MPGTNNFKQFDFAKENIMSDADYLASLTRQNGVSTGQASIALHNKLFYQLSTFVAAFAKVMSDAGFNVTDDDFDTLVTGIYNYNNVDNTGNIVIADDQLAAINLAAFPVDWGGLYDLSGLIPEGVRYAIVCIEMTQSDPNGVLNSEIWFRPNGTFGGGQMVAACRSAGGGDANGTANQVTVPVGANRKIDYKFVIPPAFGSIVTFRLQGYIV